MAMTDFVLGRPPHYDPELDPLAKPVPLEAEKLDVHVELCARRYKNIMQGVHRGELASYDIKAFIVKVGLWALVALAGVIKGPDLVLQLLKVM